MVTVVLLAIFQLFPVADRSVGLADRTTHANYLARSLMEAKLASDYSALDVDAPPIVGEYLLDAHTRRRGSDLSTKFIYEVDFQYPYPDAEVKDVLVSVSWKEGAADEQRASSVRLQSTKGKLW